MSGRHRKTPAWRRLLLRLRRSDRAARTAALQAEVVALRATVRSMRAELDSAWEAAAAATVAARRADAARWDLELPLVQAALAPAEIAETAAAASALPALAGVGSIALDLRPDTATTEILLTELRQIVLGDLPVVASAKEPAVAESAAVAAKEPATGWAELPESALLDPKKDRDDDVIDVSQPATAAAAATVLPERRSA
jgi:hypothetical protein